MSELLAKVDKKEEEDDEGGDDGPVVDEEVTVEFKPLVKLEKKAVVTGEDNEDIVHTIRVKLFEYGETLLNIGKGIKEWKEKGVGELKFLKDKTTQRNRILVRQEKTLKILSNFLVVHNNPDLKPHDGSKNSWIMSAPKDFSDPEKPVERTFAVKFNTAESYAEFKTQFEAARAEMKVLFEAKGGAKADDVDKAAEELSKVSIKEGGAAVAAGGESAAEPEGK